ncbi:hypothetical protein HDV00_011433 [Rhizophlyctis rosea]|nr:hypothetical protein HDV00_011433 [Rhizophlyctis rosea]
MTSNPFASSAQSIASHRTPKPVPHHVTSHINPPPSAVAVGEVIASMDKRYKTAFESWITDEAHRGYVCSIKKSVFEEYWRESAVGPVGVGRAIKWMSEGWTVGGVAELVLKLFYGTVPIESPAFARLCATLMDGWEDSRKSEFIAIVITGEKAELVAKFIWHLVSVGDDWSLGDAERMSNSDCLEGWKKEGVIALVREIADGLRWTTSFLIDFLMEYVLLAVRDLTQQRQLFEQLVTGIQSFRWTPASEQDIYWTLFDTILEYEAKESVFVRVMRMLPEPEAQSDLVGLGLVRAEEDNGGTCIVRSDSGCCLSDEEKELEDGRV